MKITLRFSILLLTFITNIAVYAQVGIGTTTPNGSAQLDVNSSNKGFLPPRMTSAQRIGITSPVAGLMVYQTDGTAGLYYYNGSAWIYIINSTNNILPVTNGGTGVTTSTGSGSVVLSNSPTLTTPSISSGNIQFPSSLSILPSTHATSRRASIWIDGWSLLQDGNGTGTKDFSIGQTVGGTFPSRLFISTTGDIGIGNTAPIAKLDIRTTPNSTTDPGAGYLGIGNTSTAANSAGAGALRYSTSNGGVLEYSNGIDWKPLAATKKVAVYTEVHADAGNTGWYLAGSAFNDFNTITADNVANVYPSSGGGFINGTGTGSSSDRWIAPFTGKFRITTNVYFNHNSSYLNPRVYAYKNNTTICNITSVNTGGQDIATSTSAIISMNQGDYINWKVEYNSQIWRGLYHTFFRIESVE